MPLISGTLRWSGTNIGTLYLSSDQLRLAPWTLQSNYGTIVLAGQ